MSSGQEPTGKTRRTIIAVDSKPALPRHMKLWHDKTRGRWTILAPEKIFRLDVIAVSILELCDGVRTVDEIAQQLAGSYKAPKQAILADVTSLLQELADKGVIKT